MILSFAVATIFLLEGVRIHSEYLCILSLCVIFVGWVTFRIELKRILRRLSSSVFGESYIHESEFNNLTLAEIEELSSVFASRYRSLKVEKESLTCPLPVFRPESLGGQGRSIEPFLDGVEGYIRRVFDSTHFLVLVKQDSGLLHRISDEKLLAPLSLSVDLERCFKSGNGLLSRWGIVDEKIGFIKIESLRGFIWLGYLNKSHSTFLVEDKFKKLLSHVESELGNFHKRNNELDGENIHGMPASDKQVMLHASHDIRSPLNNIRAAAQFLVLQNQAPESADLPQTILRNCQAMEDIVEVMLDYASMSSLKQYGREERLTLSDLIGETVRNFEPQAKLKNLSCVFECNQDYTILSDRRTLRRAISNLISNAIKYTDSGGVTVTLAEHGTGCRVTVADTGVGMTKLQLAKLFVPFTRFLRDRDGVGLGLVVTKHLVESAGGVLMVDSIYGKGSTFTIELPAARRTTHEISPVDSRKSGIIAQGISSEQNILVVDDDLDAAMSLRRVLESHGFSVFCANSVSEAVGICEMTEISDVITDFEMPNGGGARLISLLESRQRCPRILILSGRENLEGRYPQTILSKPVEIDLLLRWLGIIDSQVAA